MASALLLFQEPNYQFVFGGDTGDKGRGTIRFVKALIALKQKYPDRVHLILGNRDLNKMRMTSELAAAELVAPLESIPVSRRTFASRRIHRFPASA